MTGAPLVLVHGAGGTPHQWAPVVPLLADRYHLHLPTLVGHHGGRPAPNGSQTSIGTLVDGVEADMDAAGLSTAHVAGTSLGSWIALELAKRGRARTCTALTPATWHRGDPCITAITSLYRAAVPLAQLMARDPGRWTRRPRLRRLLYRHHLAYPERLQPADLARLLDSVAHCTIMPALLAWMNEHDGPSHLDTIDCPVQLVFAEHDRVLPRHVYRPRLTAALPYARIVVIPDAGHIATWDQPVAVAETIRSACFNAR